MMGTCAIMEGKRENKCLDLGGAAGARKEGEGAKGGRMKGLALE
jgi:hypothetical protein